MNENFLKRPIKLDCQVQHNSWGKYSKESLVAQLKKVIDDNKPYAELWVGAHPNFPAKVPQHETLDKLIKKYPNEILGESVVEKFGPELPFLFKILSIQTALSIQAHPNRELAQVLHQKDPKNYPDTNHKLEIAIALTHVSLLCGFRSLQEIQNYLSTVPEFKALVPEAASNHINNIYRSVMTSSPQKVSELLKQLFARLSTKEKLSPEEAWILRLQNEYPEGDVGLFCFFLLKLRFLSPGEAVFVTSGTPHAYLEGDLAECMTNSDNVVRAGLTSKHKDIATLIEMVSIDTDNDYRLAPIKDPEIKYLTRFQPSLIEYCVDQLKGDFSVECVTKNKVEVIFCLRGEGRIFGDWFVEDLRPGDAFVLPALIQVYSIQVRGGDVFRVTVPI